MFCATFYLSFKIVQYKTYIWLPDYFFRAQTNDLDNIKNGHVMFMIADHHEPGRGEKGAIKSKTWLKGYKKTVEGITDDYENLVQYTWFYPYDHHNSQVVLNLNEMVFAGFGEVEFHWHHGPDTNETFPPKLAKAVEWFNSHGAMLPVGHNPKPQFGFVHGNWALDNSDGNANHCGVNQELDILQKHGCYADFTFGSFSTAAQPSKVNSIYYVKDTPLPKSYNTGVVSQVGVVNNDFMIFEGPMSLDWHDLIFDCAAIESTSQPKPHRIKLWLKHAPVVKGRPEWLFVKVYTHGVQSQDAIISPQFKEMLIELKRYCKGKNINLHFVTAREAFNIVKAAEAGFSGNPEQYRDYVLKKPINKDVNIPCRISDVIVEKDLIKFELIQPQNTTFSFKIGPVTKIKGFVKDFHYRKLLDNHFVSIEGQGMIEILAKESIEFSNKVINNSINVSGEQIYLISANRK